MATRTKKKTVAFYEIFDQNGKSFPAPLPWDKVLARLAGQSVGSRGHVIGDTVHWGKTYTYDENDHFILARSRDEGVPSFDFMNDEIIDNETDIQKPWVEISVASFVPETNRFGFVLGSQAAPRPTSMAAWMNAHEVFEEPISAGPVINHDILAKLDGAAEARLVRVKLTSDQIEATQKSTGLFSAAKTLADEHGDVEVELIVRVSGKGKKHRDWEREQILESTRGLVGSDFKLAIAELIHYNDRGRAEVDRVNLLENRLAKKMDVSVTDNDGNPIRIQSAVAAIQRAIKILGSELR